MIARITADGRVLLSVEDTEGEEHSGEEAELTSTEEHGGEDHAHNPILPETAELVYAALAFLILLGLMAKFAYPSVKSAMDARTQRIRDNLDEAERTKAEASRILEEYQHKLADAKNESSRIIEEARQTAEQMRRDLMARAEAEVAELRQRTQDDVRAAQDRAMADLRAQVAELAVGAAEVVVQKNLDAETNRALVERFIEQVGSAQGAQ